MTPPPRPGPLVQSYPHRGLNLVEGEGVYLRDAAGTAYLDFMSNYGVAIFGHNHPALVEALGGQLRRLPVLHGSFGNDVRTEAARALAGRCGGGLARVQWTNSGAEANEAALKFAALATGRKTFIACVGGFHGKTLGALSATDGAKYRAAFEPLLWRFRFVPYGDADALEAAVDGETAAFLVEPIQGESGVRPGPAGYLRRAAGICRAKGALLIVDEIQTGLGRTGSFLASHPEEIDYDVVTMGKGLAGGIPVGATIASERVAGAVFKGAHTSTFGGNPLAAAGVLATLALLDDSRLARVADLGGRLTASLRAISSPLVREVRGKGLMVGIEVAANRDEVLKALQREKVLAIPAGEDVVRFLPPYIIEPDHIERAVSVLARVLETISAAGESRECAAS
jgi:acetylornithine/LysW-gamma-L-lysine aminotransferase